MNFIQMAGFPGSGKSTLAQALSKEIGAIVIDRDIVKTAMLKSGVTGNLLNEASYKTVYALCDFYLSIGQSVILDTPCYYDEILNTGKDIALKHGAEYKLIECQLDCFVEINNRLFSRNRLETQIHITTEEQFENSRNISKRPNEDAFIILDTSRSISDVLLDAIAFLNNQNQNTSMSNRALPI
jgi:predicted kinase